MNRFPKSLQSFLPNFSYMVLIPIFYLLSVLFYEPQSLINLLSAGEGYSSQQNLFAFNTSLSALIVLVCLIIGRLTFYLLRRQLVMTMIRYALWCVVEIFMISAFVSMYLTLMARGDMSWFIYMGRTFTALFSIFIYPYLILTLLFALRDALQADSTDDYFRMKFYDGRHQLKLITYASSVQYLESNENYVIIHYQDNSGNRTLMLRNSMKNLELLCEKAGFVRTHRSYVVNPTHIKAIRKSTKGLFFVDLGNGSEEEIPVSKKYYDGVASVL